MIFDDYINKFNEENNLKLEKEKILKTLNLMIEKIEEISNTKDDAEVFLRIATKIKRWINGGILEKITKAQLKKFINMTEKFTVKYSKTEEEKLYNHCIGELCRRQLSMLN